MFDDIFLHDRTCSVRDSLKSVVSNLNNTSTNQVLLLSCYINFDLVKKVIQDFSPKIISDVFLMFNVSEIYKLGSKQTLHKLEQYYKEQKVNFQWRVISGTKGEMVHAKGYALYDDLKESGFVMITSANLTLRGFNGVNTELGYITQKQQHIKQFVDLYFSLWDNNAIDLNEEIKYENEELFCYYLLSHGRFLNKWDINLKNLIGVQYKKLKNTESNDSLLTKLEFDSEQANLTKQYIDISHLPKKFYQGFTSKYTIRTSFGRWCPLSVWKIVEEYLNDNFSQFIEGFKSVTTDEKLITMKKQAETIQKWLSEKDIIKVKDDYLDKWIIRIKKLRENSKQIGRIYAGYEDFSLPYDYSNIKGVKNLYQSLSDSITFSQRNTLAIKKVSQAIEKMSLEYLDLSTSEKEDLIADLKKIPKLNKTRYIKGKIIDVSPEPGVYQNDNEGLKIRIKFKTENLNGFQCGVAAYFSLKDWMVLKDFNGLFTSTDGQVSVGKYFVSENDIFYDEADLFIPYEELHLNKGNYFCEFLIKLYYFYNDTQHSFLQCSQPYEFAVNIN
ncbi:phospholipase D-like domain-containing protein [Desulfobacterales bacterium HSG2]|nr:phospholipase D-like domain-containing protein [Desulfobacterales bacterium HSG2]